MSAFSHVHRWRACLVSIGLVVIGGVVALVWGPWPNPTPTPVPWHPDAIVALGGGDDARVRETLRAAEEFPGVPVIVSGDGGWMSARMLASGFPVNRLTHETEATSTIENARFTTPALDRFGARRVLVVTSWFHAPRALAVFRKYQPGREFAVRFSPRPDPTPGWDARAQRRERFAVVAYLVRYGVWGGAGSGERGAGSGEQGAGKS